MDTNIVEIFYLVDEFCKEFEKCKSGHVLRAETVKKSRNRAFTMSDSEVITKLKKNMKNALMLIRDKLILRKRAIIKNELFAKIC